MALSEIDPSSLPTSERIRRHEFSTVRRGYDQVQVRDYLKKIAGHVVALDHKLARLEAGTSNDSASSSTQPTEDPYDKLASRVAELLRAAEAESERIVAEAQAEASHTLDEASTGAERVRAEAKDHAEKTRREADRLLSESKIASEQTLAALWGRREALMRSCTRCGRSCSIWRVSWRRHPPSRRAGLMSRENLISRIRSPLVLNHLPACSQDQWARK